MALNVSSVSVQIALLQRQSATASHTARMLSTYKAELIRSWSGVEMSFFCSVIDKQILECENLTGELDCLCRDLARTMQEILEKETAAAASDSV